MKKILLLIAALCIGVANVYAQDMEQFESKLIWKDRAKYFNIAFVNGYFLERYKTISFQSFFRSGGKRGLTPFPPIFTFIDTVCI